LPRRRRRTGALTRRATPLDADLVARWLRDFHLPAVVPALISVAYFLAAAPGQSFVRRAVASAHGLVISALYVRAWLVYLTGHAGDAWMAPFAALMLVPLGFMLASLFIFRGRARVHLLQLPNLFCLPWVWFRGTAVVTGFVF
jgi:lipopolysaccharide export LptBFGC system permease protein LptF